MTRKPPLRDGIGFNGWHRIQLRQKTGDFMPETQAPCSWDKLRRELQLTEEQALQAVECGDAPGQKLRIFVRRVCQDRFVPESVLSFLSLTRMSEGGALGYRDSIHGRRG
jgi:hypothetical protein